MPKRVGAVLGQVVAGQHTNPPGWVTIRIPEWPQIKNLLQDSPGLEAKTIFEHLQRTLEGKYQDGQLRTLQRRIKQWRATEGPAKEVFFLQNHYPGILAASDFTHMDDLGITIRGELLNPLSYCHVARWAKATRSCSAYRNPAAKRTGLVTLGTANALDNLLRTWNGNLVQLQD